jgi:hypothetical protein
MTHSPRATTRIRTPSDDSRDYAQPPRLAPVFTPVPMERTRHNGWTAERQGAFILALTTVGQVEAACKMLGISRKSAYALRARPGADSFARAWDVAISEGRRRVFDYMMDRAINGYTTIRLRAGGAVDISHGLDQSLVAGALKAPMAGRNSFASARPGKPIGIDRFDVEWSATPHLGVPDHPPVPDYTGAPDDDYDEYGVPLR